MTTTRRLVDLVTEKATYDPDLPHDWMRGASSRDCALCGRPGKDELHAVVLTERAYTGVQTEKGT